MLLMQVHSQVRDYDVHWEQTSEFVQQLDAIPNRLTVVDANFWQAHGAGALASVDRNLLHVFPVSEDRKNLEGVSELVDVLIERSAKKNVTLVCYGGGILQDVAGFAASTLYRGINWVFVPTTLLAQCDSCIGSKTSLNYKGVKNLLGTFFPPSAVYIHTPFLMTQQVNDYFSGLGEVIKLHIMGGKPMAEELVRLLPSLKDRQESALEAAIQTSLKVKGGYIAEDEFDRGRRNLLNYGHCFGHALESVTAFEIPHGQAVVSGMILANVVAVDRSYLSRGTSDYLLHELLLPGLRVRPRREHLLASGLLAAMGKDKKRTGAGLALIVLKESFDLEKVDDLSPGEVEKALSSFMELLGLTP